MSKPSLWERAADKIRRTLGTVKVSRGEHPSVRLLHGVKLYREVHIDGLVFRGTADTPGRTINYLFDLLPAGALTGKTTLDLGTAGGAVCFEAVQRGARMAVGVETEDRRIRGGRYIQRRLRQDKVRFVQQDFWEFFRQERPETDVIFCLNVLHHFANPLPLLRRIARAARERIVIEIPIVVQSQDYNEYGAGFADVSSEGSIRSADDITRFLALYDFALERQSASPVATKFSGSDEVQRAVYIYARDNAAPVKSRDARLQEVAPFRDARTASWSAARADAANLDCRPDESLQSVLSRALGDAWAQRGVNVVLCGPAAAGKSHLYESAGAAAHPSYNYKIFKFPNDKGQGGLQQHLNPAPGQGGMVAQALLNTVDDYTSHCTPEELASATAGRPVVCLVLNVPFDEHVERLYRRQAERVGTRDAAVDYEVPLRFDCTKVIAALRQHHADYRVLTIVPGT